MKGESLPIPARPWESAKLHRTELAQPALPVEYPWWKRGAAEEVARYLQRCFSEDVDAEADADCQYWSRPSLPPHVFLPRRLRHHRVLKLSPQNCRPFSCCQAQALDRCIRDHSRHSSCKLC